MLSSNLAQVLVQRFSADAKFTGQLCLLLAGFDALQKFSRAVGRKRFFAAPVSSAQFGERNTFFLSLTDQRPLEFGERTHNRQHQVRHRRILTGEGQAFFDELDAHTSPGQLLHKVAQVIEVAGQAIHAVHHHRISFAHEGQQRVKFWALGVLARCLVGEYLSDFDLFQLPLRVLVEAADPDVADTLTLQDAPKQKSVRNKSMTLRSLCQ